MADSAFITGIEGLSLGGNERAFLRDADPWGFILFKRNVDTPGAGARASWRRCARAVGRNAPVLIDQEGGRVQRLGAAALAELSARRRLRRDLRPRPRRRGLRPRGSARG